MQCGNLFTDYVLWKNKKNTFVDLTSGLGKGWSYSEGNLIAIDKTPFFFFK